MMRRVRSGKQKRIGIGPFFPVRIPRKGRLRLVLVVLLLAIGLKVFFGKAKKEHSQAAPVKQTSSTSVVSPATVEHRSFFRFFKSPRTVAPSVKSFALSHGDVAALLRSAPLTFSTLSDSVIGGSAHYTVHYSLDTAVQNYGKKLLARYHPKYGAVVAMDPVSGRIQALISYTREGETSLGDRLYCKSIFPAASVFKTVTAAGAIERGNIGPESTFALTGRRYTLYKFQLAPELHNGQEVTLEDAYSLSINPIFGRIGIYVLGTAGLREYMRKFGFNESIIFDLDNENPIANEQISDSLLTIAETASGFNRVTKISPLFGALIASSVAEKGKMPVPTLVDSVCFADLSLAYKVSPSVLRTPIKESTAQRLKELMSCVVQRGTARKAFTYARRSACFDNIEYGGKTGSVDDETLGKIDWFIGFACGTDQGEKRRIAVGVVTVHDEFWTVHSSFIGEELFRTYFRGIHPAAKSKRHIDTTTRETIVQDTVTEGEESDTNE